MSQKENILSVDELTNIIKLTITEKLCNNVKVTGEISNVKISNQNMYFTLKDELASINVVMWKLQLDKQKFEQNLKNGDNVIVTGKITCFTKQGTYQITSTKIERIGIGDLHEKYKKLKEQYELNGYFSKKREFPKHINRIAILTSTEGAALQDILYVLNYNSYNGEIYIKNCSVQGNLCPKSVQEGIHYFNLLNNTKKIDILLISRGGGSFEDLMGYSSLEIVTSIYHSELFIISAVGHEIDWMLSDFAADCRAPTPSIAAEMISSVYKQKIDMLHNVKEQINKLEHIINNKLEHYNDKIENCNNMLVMINPVNYINTETEKINKYKTLIINKVFSNIDKLLNNVKFSMNENNKYSINNTFNKGYVAIIDQQYNLVNNKETFIKLLNEKNNMKIIFNDGEYNLALLF
jgi:exodeoxyribonuclease VII large subunit